MTSWSLRKVSGDRLSVWKYEIFEYHCFSFFAEACVSLSEIGKVSRNCTPYGWSEPYPQYDEICFPFDNITKHVWSCLFPYNTQMSCLFKVQLVISVSPCLGHVLCICQSPVYSGVQHISSVSDHSHGYSLQIQVRFYYFWNGEKYVLVSFVFSI